MEEHILKSGYVTVNLSLKQDRKSTCAALSLEMCTVKVLKYFI